MKNFSRSSVYLIAMLALGLTSNLVMAVESTDPNKAIRNASPNSNNNYQPPQRINPIQVNPLRQYEEAMAPIYDLTIRETTAKLKSDSSDPSLYARRGEAYASKKDYKNALADYDSSLKLKADQAALYAKRAIMHFMLKNYDKSWVNVREAEKRGAELSASFLDALKKVSGRKK